MTSRARKEDRFTTFGVCDLKNVNAARNRKRFYTISLQPGLFEPIVERRWGRIGCTPRVKEEFCPDMAEALKLANRLYRRKIGKGYVDVEQSIGKAAHIADTFFINRPYIEIFTESQEVL